MCAAGPPARPTGARSPSPPAPPAPPHSPAPPPAPPQYKRAVEIYEQIAISSLESSLLKFSVRDYLLRAGICRLATGEIGAAVNALDRYEGMDATFSDTREGTFLRALVGAYENLDADTFTETVREYDEISRLDAQKTSLLLEVKNKIKASQEDIT